MKLEDVVAMETLQQISLNLYSLLEFTTHSHFDNKTSGTSHKKHKISISQVLLIEVIIFIVSYGRTEE